MKKVSVIIAEDHDLLRETFGISFKKSTFIETIRLAENGKVVLEQLEEELSDIVFLDIDMPVMNGFECLKIIQKKFPSVKVIAITSFTNQHHVLDMHLLNIDGFLTKNINLKEVDLSIQEVLNNRHYYTPRAKEALEQLLEYMGSDVTFERAMLSENEIAVLKHICLELSNEKIAEELNLSVSSIKKYRTSLLTKTQSHTSAGLALFAVKNKLFGWGDLLE